LSPPERLREELEAARSRGEDFEAAWVSAWRPALDGASRREEWEAVFEATKGAWRGGYHRRGSRGLVDAMTVLHVVEEAADDSAPGQGVALVA
jgi:hypothetical protein